MNHRTFILVPGAWMGQWIWAGIEQRLRARGQVVHAMTLPGLESPPLLRYQVSLETHVRHVVDFMKVSNLREVVLVGHGYSGLVVGQAAQRLPDRVCHTVFLEAYVPEEGRSLLELADLDVEAVQRQINDNQGLWPVPSERVLAYETQLTTADHRFLKQRLVGHPGRTVTDPVRLQGPLADLSATYVGRQAPAVIRDWLTLPEPERNWHHIPLAGGHWPMLSTPDQLTSALLSVGCKTAVRALQT
ncbi:alpha/beta hydrolase [Natronospirillum operosum]|uniref:Alpha/beta hydrolase n=1 Tax=Natronospirillum operosum TaxID=2759953 RepID=A0A4Z0WFV6_9GAMM|nr:alpha/beta hydrolase [Natronospirillum operosum]TGG93448.1 alpha/beta hydrolase [Natronospirillum operosum]